MGYEALIQELRLREPVMSVCRGTGTALTAGLITLMHSSEEALFAASRADAASVRTVDSVDETERTVLEWRPSRRHSLVRIT